MRGQAMMNCSEVAATTVLYIASPHCAVILIVDHLPPEARLQMSLVNEI